MSDYLQVITTTEKKHDAEAIARMLVEKRLAACVQIVGPVTSVYRWQGQIETAEEFQVIAKSRRELFARIEQAIGEAHPYDVPEILAVPVDDGSRAYLAWLDGEVGQP
jgi:periplasmic divalent cation tolerance protein